MDNKGKGNKKQAKKGTDFFGDLDLWLNLLNNKISDQIYSWNSS